MRRQGPWSFPRWVECWWGWGSDCVGEKIKARHKTLPWELVLSQGSFINILLFFIADWLGAPLVLCPSTCSINPLSPFIRQKLQRYVLMVPLELHTFFSWVDYYCSETIDSAWGKWPTNFWLALIITRTTFWIDLTHYAQSFITTRRFPFTLVPHICLLALT